MLDTEIAVSNLDVQHRIIQLLNDVVSLVGILRPCSLHILPL